MKITQQGKLLQKGPLLLQVFGHQISGSDPILTARRLALELEPPELPETLEGH